MIQAMTNQPAIRRATAADLPQLVELDAQSFPQASWSETAFASELASEHTGYWVAEVAGAVVGAVGVLAAVGAGEADVQTIAVAADYRRHRLATRLLREGAAWAVNRGAKQLFLEVRETGAPARMLYESLGFTEIGRRENYYPAEQCAAIVMRADARRLLAAIDAKLRTEAPKRPLVLGIESSCDETGVGIVRGRELLANAVASSMDEHAKYGGVVPEVAARAHADAIVPVLRQALDEAGVELNEIDAVAVTAGPGLAGALMVGVGAAKALAAATGKPLYGVNHLVGHVAADLLRDQGAAIEFPAIALLVSGGHTSLIRVDSLTGDSRMLGETIDDAAGEAFDKVARVLGLPYPGGPHIDRIAADGNATDFSFPRGLTHPKDRDRHRFDFSFSGLKTSVARTVEGYADRGETVPLADIAASFREAVADVLLTKALDACQYEGIPRLLLGGGVVANARVRELAEQRCAAAGVSLHVPPLSLCTDNGAMIAVLGAELVAAGRAPSPVSFAADSTLPMTCAQVIVGAAELTSTTSPEVETTR